MAEPTLEDDLTALGLLALSRAGKTGPIRAETLLRLDRVSAALRDREHLETGARMLSSQLEWSIAAGLTPKNEVTDWIEAERARRQRT